LGRHPRARYAAALTIILNRTLASTPSASRYGALLGRRAPAPLAKAGVPWRWAWAGLLLGLSLALVLFAPARWLTEPVQNATGQKLQLLDARGTVWRGSARLVLTGGAGSKDASALPTPVRWKLQPAWAGAQLVLWSDCCTAQPLAVRLQIGGLQQVQATVADATSTWPAALLSGLGTPWNTLQPEGQLQLRTQALVLNWSPSQMAVAGKAQLEVVGLSSRLSTLRPMGSYRLAIQGGSTPTVELSTLEGSLQLAGTGQWAGSRLRFSGSASAAPEHEAALSNLLNIIGRRQGPRSLITIG
jgi:general secretion pathway protein N